MKNYRKNIWSVCLLIALQACGQADKGGREEVANRIAKATNDTTQMAKATTADVNLNGDGKMFVLSAATGGAMEIEAAKLAIKKGKDKLVKDFAAQMLKAHTLSNDELNGIANHKGFELPEALPEDLTMHLKDFNTLAGRAFDQQYIRMMISDHQKTVQLFTEGTRLKDPELRAFAIKTLPLIKQHSQTAENIGKHLNISNVNNGDDILGLSPEKSKNVNSN